MAKRIAIPKNGSEIVRAREEGRARLHARIGERYSPWLHLGATMSIGMVALAVAIAKVHHPTLRELLTIPIVFLLSNASEWRAHKSLLHHRVKPLHELYDRHTPEHHMVFGYDDMAIRSFKELKLVLIPAVGVAGIVVGTTPFALVAAWLFGANVGWLFAMTSALYVVGYELSHLSYHLPPDSFIGRLWLVRVLREQHRRHHHPRLMQKWNFNVTFPIFDFVHRTIVPREVLEQTLAEDRAASPEAASDAVAPVTAPAE